MKTEQTETLSVLLWYIGSHFFAFFVVPFVWWFRCLKRSPSTGTKVMCSVSKSKKTVKYPPEKRQVYKHISQVWIKEPLAVRAVLTKYTHPASFIQNPHEKRLGVHWRECCGLRLAGKEIPCLLQGLRFVSTNPHHSNFLLSGQKRPHSRSSATGCEVVCRGRVGWVQKMENSPHTWWSSQNLHLPVVSWVMGLSWLLHAFY